MLLLSLALLLLPSAVRAQDAPLRRFEIEGVGTLAVPVPPTWRASREKDTTVLYRAPTGELLMLSVLRNATGAGDFVAPARVRGELEADGRSHLDTAVEKKLELVELKGASNTGYYFVLTDRKLVDREPGPNEYRVLTRGMLGAGELLLYFTLLSQQKDTPALREALAALRAAKVSR
jgi:hypothetical protein